MQGQKQYPYYSRIEAKRDQEWFSDCHMMPYKAPSEHTDSFKGIILYWIPTAMIIEFPQVLLSEINLLVTIYMKLKFITYELGTILWLPSQLGL